MRNRLQLMAMWNPISPGYRLPLGSHSHLFHKTWTGNEEILACRCSEALNSSAAAPSLSFRRLLALMSASSFSTRVRSASGVRQGKRHFMRGGPKRYSKARATKGCGMDTVFVGQGMLSGKRHSRNPAPSSFLLRTTSLSYRLGIAGIMLSFVG